MPLREGHDQSGVRKFQTLFLTFSLFPLQPFNFNLERRGKQHGKPPPPPNPRIISLLNSVWRSRTQVLGFEFPPRRIGTFYLCSSILNRSERFLRVFFYRFLAKTLNCEEFPTISLMNFPDVFSSLSLLERYNGAFFKLLLLLLLLFFFFSEEENCSTHFTESKQRWK